MAEWAFVALGSNVGNREKRLRAGRDALKGLANSSLVSATDIDETNPIGPGKQDGYLNQMVLLRTALRPEDLLRECHRIEKSEGRTRGERWGPRTLDLDIVRFGDRHSSTPELTLPHLELPNREFWLRELAELIPATWDPKVIGLPVWAEVSSGRRRHIERVTALLETWAVARKMPAAEQRRWVKAGFLHDALKDAPKARLLELSGSRWSTPSLYHGPASARMAREHGETDQGILDAVTFHSVGYAGWDDVGRMLYLADYLEPGRSHRRPQRAQLAARVPRDPTGVLRNVAEQRVLWTVTKGMPLLDEGVAFWNSLVDTR